MTETVTDMSDYLKICVLGGDRRLTSAVGRFGKRYECAVWGLDVFPECAVKCADWRDAVKGAEAIVLPLPVTRDGESLAGADGVMIADIIAYADRGALICGGMIPSFLRELAVERGCEVYDYYESEDVQIKNADPTAEGVIGALISEMPVTVSGMTVTVTGYGRCARTLAQKLILLGADVYAVARSERDLAWAAVDGCAAVSLNDYREFPVPCDAVVNTVPLTLFDADLLAKLDNRTVIFDISAGCVGVDRAAAEKCGIKVVPLPSLPGKTAPETAGNIIADAILKRLDCHFRKGGAGI